MKRYYYLVFAALVSGTAMAQDQYDAANFTASDLNGTARYVGMGGALDALGGDISTMSSNPAGTGLFRHPEGSLTMSVLFSDEKGQLGHDAARASFDQGGVVFSMEQENRGRKGLQFVNFGFNYVKHRNHFGNANLAIQNLANTFSQTYQMADLANIAYDNDDWGYLADLAAPMYDDKGKLIKDGVIIDWYDDITGKFLNYDGNAAANAKYRRATYGSTAQADFNVSMNLSDQFFFGISLGSYNLNSKRESNYYEMGTDNHYYDISNWYDSEGTGFNIKLGTIIRPLEESPFRFGVTIHTPIWYNLKDMNGASLYYENQFVQSVETDPYRYHFRTPWKFGFSLGHTVGKSFAFGASYELQDFSTSHYNSKDNLNENYFMDMNQNIKDDLKTQHVIRVGAEFKPVDEFAIRLGYNYLSSPYNNKAFKYISYNSPFTETDYTNWKDVNRFTLGVGYRFKGGYFDVAYQLQSQEGDFYAFDDVDLKPTEIKNNRSQVMATLGFRF